MVPVDRGTEQALQGLFLYLSYHCSSSASPSRLQRLRLLTYDKTRSANAKPDPNPTQVPGKQRHPANMLFKLARAGKLQATSRVRPCARGSRCAPLCRQGLRELGVEGRQLRAADEADEVGGAAQARVGRRVVPGQQRDGTVPRTLHFAERVSVQGGLHSLM